LKRVTPKLYNCTPKNKASLKTKAKLVTCFWQCCHMQQSQQILKTSTKEKWFPFSELYSGYYQYAILSDQWMVNGNSTWKRNNENII
jgi:hypothetical protein